ncbi:MAG: lipid-A-disaccharide synthase [Candidatus Omnitrophica bacterium]|nr:lipid-A-disaccharide synthase [Candidatus Omnitrophota bacterium]
MEQKKHILIVCGESSGDLNAANLAKAMLAISPAIKISGIGGGMLREAGAEIYSDIKELSVMGLFDVLIKLPKFIALKELLLEKLQREKFDAVILVDFSGFNLRLAKEINKALPVIYYVSPQVWASRPGRIKDIKKYIHKMIVLFKFEQEFYKKHSIDADFAGHPLLDIVRPSKTKKEFLRQLNLSESKTTITLLPGSRNAEIRNILPVMLKASRLIARQIGNIQFVIAKSPNVDIEAYNEEIYGLDLDLKIVEDKTYDCLNIADFCLVCSGTATLEAAIMEKPFFIIYKMNPLNYLLYRPQIKIPYIGIVNIVAGKKIVPEFVQWQANPAKISEETVKILRDASGMEKMKNELAGIKLLLGDKGASERAARKILEFIGG